MRKKWGPPCNHPGFYSKMEVRHGIKIQDNSKSFLYPGYLLPSSLKACACCICDTKGSPKILVISHLSTSHKWSNHLQPYVWRFLYHSKLSFTMEKVQDCCIFSVHLKWGFCIVPSELLFPPLVELTGLRLHGSLQEVVQFHSCYLHTTAEHSTKWIQNSYLNPTSEVMWLG